MSNTTIYLVSLVLDDKLFNMQSASPYPNFYAQSLFYDIDHLNYLIQKHAQDWKIKKRSITQNLIQVQPHLVTIVIPISKQGLHNLRVCNKEYVLEAINDFKRYQELLTLQFI